MNRPLALVLNVARQWWPALVVLLVLSTGLGVVAGQRSELTSSVYFRVDPSAQDSTRVTQATQTAVRVIESSGVYDAAARALDTTASQLRARTAVAVIPSSELVAISAQCEQSAACTRDLEALAQATRDSLERTAQEQFASIAAGGALALDQGALPSAAAEQARQDALGASAATRQDAAVSAGTGLTQVGDPTPATKAGLTRSLGAALGLLLGLILAVLWILALGVRAGRVRRAEDWTVRQGVEQCFAVEDVGRLAHRLVDDRVSLVLVSTTGDSGTGRLAELARLLQSEMQLEGAATALVRISRGTATLVEGGGDVTRVPSPLGQVPRNELLARCRADVAIAYSDGRSAVLPRAGSRVAAAVFLAEGSASSYRRIRGAFASARPVSSYAVLA